MEATYSKRFVWTQLCCMRICVAAIVGDDDDGCGWKYCTALAIVDCGFCWLSQSSRPTCVHASTRNTSIESCSMSYCTVWRYLSYGFAWHFSLSNAILSLASCRSLKLCLNEWLQQARNTTCLDGTYMAEPRNWELVKPFAMAINFVRTCCVHGGKLCTKLLGRRKLLKRGPKNML